MRYVVRLFCLLGAVLGGCTGRVCPVAAGNADVVFVLSRGWHTEIGLPAGELTGGAAVFRRVFPGAVSVMFGYGKRTFMTAPTDDVRELLLGPLPGPAVIEVFALRVLPPEAFGRQDMVTLKLPPGGAAALSNFLWSDLKKDSAGQPLLVAPGKFAGSLFYGARSGYGLMHTCNGWVADALHAAGLDVDASGVLFSGQVMARATHAAAAYCSGGLQALRP